METHPLNLAHRQYRRAEALMKNNRYDDAMLCHQNAAELLLDAMKSTSSTFALESITLQHTYHLKQMDIIKSKKEQHARVKKAMENIKCLSIDPNLNLIEKDHSKLQVAIYKAINESESLLHILSDKTDPATVQQTIINDFSAGGKKTEKNPQIVVEELQTLSQNLYALVEQLVLQVEVLKDESITLKDKISYLERERLKYFNISSQAEYSYSSELPGISSSIDMYAQDPNKQLNNLETEKSSFNDTNQ